MAITNQDGLVAALATSQQVLINKVGARATLAYFWYSVFDLTGNPGAGVLAIGNTANGVVPTNPANGYPTINAFGAGNTGYVLNFSYGWNVAARLRLWDTLFAAGAYSYNANVTLASQPSFAARIPNADYKGTELWLECITAFTGSFTLTVTYTNQDGVAGRSTVYALGVAPTVGRMFQVPLASGDTGIQKIESVVGSVSTAGTFNLLVLRPLISVRVALNNAGAMYGADMTAMPIVFSSSALRLMVAADGTSAGAGEVQINIGNG